MWSARRVTSRVDAGWNSSAPLLPAMSHIGPLRPLVKRGCPTAASLIERQEGYVEGVLLVCRGASARLRCGGRGKVAELGQGGAWAAWPSQGIAGLRGLGSVRGRRGGEAPCAMGWSES